MSDRRTLYKVRDSYTEDAGWSHVDMKEDGHYCEAPDDTPDSYEQLYGTAIGFCEEDVKGRFFVSNDEYANQVNYCPFCGVKAGLSLEFGSSLQRSIEDHKDVWKKLADS